MIVYAPTNIPCAAARVAVTFPPCAPAKRAPDRLDACARAPSPRDCRRRRVALPRAVTRPRPASTARALARPPAPAVPSLCPAAVLLSARVPDDACISSWALRGRAGSVGAPRGDRFREVGSGAQGIAGGAYRDATKALGLGGGCGGVMGDRAGCGVRVSRCVLDKAWQLARGAGSSLAWMPCWTWGCMGATICL